MDHTRGAAGAACPAFPEEPGELPHHAGASLVSRGDRQHSRGLVDDDQIGVDVYENQVAPSQTSARRIGIEVDVAADRYRPAGVCRGQAVDGQLPRSQGLTQASGRPTASLEPFRQFDPIFCFGDVLDEGRAGAFGTGGGRRGGLGQGGLRLSLGVEEHEIDVVTVGEHPHGGIAEQAVDRGVQPARAICGLVAEHEPYA